MGGVKKSHTEPELYKQHFVIPPSCASLLHQVYPKNNALEHPNTKAKLLSGGIAQNKEESLKS